MHEHVNEVIHCLKNHRSIRRFEQREIPADVLETILSTGIRAATGGNLQHYSFIVIDDQETKNKLNAVDKYHDLSKIPLIIIALVDTYRLQCWFKANNSVQAHTNEAATFFIGYWDAIIALHNITIAAESLGLGTFYNGNVLGFNIQELFDAPEGIFPAGMVCIGYPHPELKTSLSDRLPLEAVVHRNKYKRFTDKEIRELYKPREAIWDRVSDELKQKLAGEQIFNIPQAVAKQKFSQELSLARGREVFKNLERSGFQLFYFDEELSDED